MKTNLRLLAAMLALGAGSLTLVAQEPQAPMTPQEKKNLKMVKDWWREVITAGHVELAPNYQAEDYIQHNPNIATGRASFMEFFGKIRKPQPIGDVLPDAPVVEFAKGDYVVLVWNHAAVDPTNPKRAYMYNSFDVLRIQNGKVQEHWDSAKRNPPAPGAAPVSFTQPANVFAAKEPKLTQQEEKNKAIATKEMKDMLQYGHLEVADEVMADSYIQHNPNVPGSLEGFKKFFGGNPNRKVEDIKPEWKNPPTLVITSGPYVLYMTDRKAKDPGDPTKEYVWDHFDLLRVENGKIQEHWDEAEKNPPAPGR